MIKRDSKKIVNCPVCLNTQEEFNLMKDDKFAWQCKKCECIIENGKPHVLEGQAAFCFPRSGGGNVCSGFGGIVGSVPYNKSKDFKG